MLARIVVAVAAVLSLASASTVLTISSVQAAYESSFSIGERVALDASKYAIAASCQQQNWTITNSTAAAIALEFSSVTLSNGDKLTVTSSSSSTSSSAANSSAVEVTSTAQGFTTPALVGNTVRITYVPSATCVSTASATTSGSATAGSTTTVGSTTTTSTTSSSSSSSFTLSAMSIRYTRKFLPQKEAVCGANTMKNAKCFASSGATMYKKSQAVLRTFRTRSDGLITVCTAWLWGNKGHMITNNHCFSSQEMVDATEFHFGVETSSCTTTCDPGTCTVETTVVGKGHVKFIKSNDTVDVALLQLTSGADAILKRYGYLRARYGHPVLGESIYIPQHPGGGPLMIAATDNDADSKTGTILNLDLSATTDGRTFTGLVGYNLDTESGSSGSPVLSATSHVVVGLHRIGMCENAATPVNKLLAFIVPLVATNNDGFVIE